MPFRPSIHGWPFANDFACESTALGLGASPLPELGLGGGMCWAALDRYLTGIEIRRNAAAPAPEEPLYAELVRRQVAALSGVWEGVREWQSCPDSSWRDRVPVPIPVGGGDIASRTRAGWPTLRRRLNRGLPVLLTVLPEADGYLRNRAAWQVLAYGWSREGSRITLSVYDPDRPGDDSFHLAFSLVSGVDARFTGGRRIRGFFPVLYDRDRTEILRAETFADRTVIGLNRRVHGRLSAAATGRRLDLVARDEDGSLLHFGRERGEPWEGTNVTEREGFGTFELHSDPVAMPAGRGLHVFGRSYVGDLLHFRLGRKWTVTNRTDHKRAGPRFRIEGRPVPVRGPLGRISVLARGRDGGVIHYSGQPFLGWSAEDVPMLASLSSSQDPFGLWTGKTLNVLTVDSNGRLLHSERVDDNWRPVDVDAERRTGPAVRLTGRPAVLLVDNAILVFARDGDGRLVRMERPEGERWRTEIVADRVTGDPVATVGPAGVHVFAPGDADGLVHAWGRDAWRCEDIVASRPSIAARGALAGALVAWGSSDELRVFGRRDRDLVLFRWHPDADWTGELVEAHSGVAERHRPADDPVLVVDRDGRPHLMATDGRGTVVHLEPAEWREPGAEEVGPKRPAPIASPASLGRRSKLGEAARRAIETSTDEPAPLPLLDEVPAEPGATADEMAHEPAATADEVADEPDATSDDIVPEPLPLLDDVDPEAGSESVESEPDPLPLLEDPVDGAEEPLPLVWPEDDEPIEAPVEGTNRVAPPAEPAPAPAPAKADDEDDEDDDVLEVEPMDLSLMDSWPDAGGDPNGDGSKENGSAPGRKDRPRKRESA